MEFTLDLDTLTFAEAKELVARCSPLYSEVIETEDGHRCSKCQLRFIPDTKTKSGFRHYHPADETKTCGMCGASGLMPPEDHYHPKDNSLDRLWYSCMPCFSADERKRRVSRSKTHTRRQVWVPKALWAAMERVRGNQSIAEFITQSIRAEVERRVHLIERQRLQQLTGATQVPKVTSFTCPRCDVSTFHPVDIIDGWCRNCEDWTRTLQSA